jgi:hypothetical protein
MRDPNAASGIGDESSRGSPDSTLGAEDTEPEEGVHDAEVLTETREAVQLVVGSGPNTTTEIVSKSDLPDEFCRSGAQFEVEMRAGTAIKARQTKTSDWTRL